MVATLNTTVIQNASSSTANITLDTAGNVTGGANLIATGMPYGSSSFLRNKIINGNMVIDQRNAGASVANTNTSYTLDRWKNVGTTNSLFNIQQNGGSVTPPVGFSNYLGCTSTSNYSVGTTNYTLMCQPIEGYNIADLAWGTSSAKSVTLSFWAYSSLTGTFGGTINNGAANRFYVFSYSLPSANTWTYITITISGDTTGTWSTNNAIGLNVYFSLGAGTSVSGTAGSWGSTAYFAPTGATSVVGTSSATFYITGVQLEQGSVATPFERPLYNAQLAQCQRYYWNESAPQYSVASTSNGSAISATITYPTPMRATPTITNPFTDGNYNTSPTGVQWYFTQPYVGASTKTGTVSPNASATALRVTFYFNGATFSNQPTAINSASGCIVQASAEL